MKHMKLQDLLAPTWRERVRAEDALLADLINFPDKTTIWPKEVQDEIRLLQPSPEVFLSALVAFWADVSEQENKEWMKKYPSESAFYLPQSCASPYLAQFPMEPPIPPVTTNIMRGMTVWSFISRLGPYAKSIEQQLIACLDHPVSTVWDAAESAFGLVNSMSDEGFAKLLSFADRSGRNGQIWKRAQVIAKHVTNDRMASVLENLEPGISEILSTARFAIIGKLDGNNAHIGLAYLLRYLSAPWSDDQLVDLIRAMTSLSERIGFKPQVVPAIRQFAKHDNPVVRSTVTYFLASHSPVENHAILKSLVEADGIHPWILHNLCRGLIKHPFPPQDLVHTAISRSIGNYDGYDGEPHDSAVALLVHMGENTRIALPEILAWWDRASANKYLEHGEVKDALDISDALGASAVPLNKGLKQALTTLTTSEEQEELPPLGQPGAVETIQARLETDMENAGVNPEEASRVAMLHGLVLKDISDNMGNIQDEIDAQQAAFDAERREIYPERYMNEDNAETGEGEGECEDMPEEEDELITRLRNTIAILDAF